MTLGLKCWAGGGLKLTASTPLWLEQCFSHFRVQMNPLEILLNADAASLGVRQSVPFLQAPGDTSTVGPRTTLSNKTLSSGFDTLLQLRATWELPKLSCLGHTQCQ